MKPRFTQTTADSIAVVGPTAVGKTTFAIDLAISRGSTEIVSVDSRQIYRETTIGTAKPSSEELAAVPHHLVSERSIENPVTAEGYAQLVKDRLDAIECRGNRVILVGGSTLYLHAVLFGFDDIPPSDRDVRVELGSRLESEGLARLVRELEQTDPKTAARIDLANPRRVLRALEVYHSTGRPMSDFTSAREPSSPNVFETIVLSRPRDILYERINARVDAMYRDGLIDEVAQILDEGHSPSLQALQTIGYRETISFLRGEIERDRMIELVKRNSRRYAKRQITWFKRYTDFRWIELES